MKPTLRIQTPCHEAWEAMPVDGFGRYCHVCTKTVVDLSDCTETRARQILATQRGPTCARLRVDATGRALFLAAAAATGLAACADQDALAGRIDTGFPTTDTAGDTVLDDPATASAPQGATGRRAALRQAMQRLVTDTLDRVRGRLGAGLPEDDPSFVPQVRMGKVAAAPTTFLLGDLAVEPAPHVEMGEVAFEAPSPEEATPSAPVR